MRVCIRHVIVLLGYICITHRKSTNYENMVSVQKRTFHNCTFHVAVSLYKFICEHVVCACMRTCARACVCVCVCVLYTLDLYNRYVHSQSLLSFCCRCLLLFVADSNCGVIRISNKQHQTTTTEREKRLRMYISVVL